MDFKRHQRQSCLSSLEKKPENPHIELISLECRHGGFCTHTKTSNTAPKVIVHKSYIELSLLMQCKRQHIKILLIRDMVVERCNRQFGRETVHPTKKFTSINLLQMSCVMIQAYLFLTSIEAVRGQTPYSDRTLWHCGTDQTLS